MKQKDIILIVVMVFIGAVASLLVSRLIFSAPKNRQQTAEVVDVINTEFPAPPPKYFNSNSSNPARPIQVGTGSNQSQ
ncbi:MAG TPA: hypothetical protein VMR45_02175 [Patescibacteria group bacterium]|nr:hypothetical protein [Patescibacteria group bacterium]